MGLFSFITDAAKDANEDAHGHRLLTGVQSTFLLIPKLKARNYGVVVKGYVQILNRLVSLSHSWSRDERIDIGKKMQVQTREKFDVDISGSYAKWLAGAWLESGERTGAKARQAHSLLAGLAESMLE